MTPEKLQKEIAEILSVLKSQGKVRLAKCIEENWDKPVLDYSKELNSWQPERPIEKEMISAFSKELERLETPANLKSKILDSLERRRVLQTGPHLCVTQNPRMLGINWLESLGVDQNEYDIVAMFSGVPFSNKSRSGRINRTKDSINLLPSSMQDALVYGSLIPDKLAETTPKLPQNLRDLLPKAVVGGSFTKWALQGCQNIQRKIVGKNNMFFLDINEVIKEYLLLTLQNKDHVIYKILFDRATREEFIKALPGEIIFYSPISDGKCESMDNLVFSENSLKGKKQEIRLDNPKNLILELQENRLCPAMIVGFLSLAFLNEFKCFGSVAQVEYLPAYQEKLAGLEFLKGFKIDRVATANLTTGTFPKNPDLYPADIIIEGIGTENFLPDPNILFGELLLPMRDIIINKSYFTGNERKK